MCPPEATRCEACGRHRLCVNGMCGPCRAAADADHAEAHAREDAE